MSIVHDATPCVLGEGPLWHPERGQLFWFDILGRRLLAQDEGRTRTWDFDRIASAAGWVDRDRLIVASETGLFLFDLGTGASGTLCEVEADRPDTRSNDGRADPWGGFWFGTMGKAAEPGAGAIYRWHLGTLRRLHGGITIPNSICFSPDRRFAYFTDTPTRIIRRQPLDAATGWPEGAAEDWLDLRPEGLNPDGSVTDAEGNIWNAQWGAGRVACYSPDGRFLRAVGFPARHTSCPAFGGAGLSTLFCTSAREHLPPDILAAEPANGQTFAAGDVAVGTPEPRVILPA
jgi:sugar lactone lactonase YvrE